MTDRELSDLTAQCIRCGFCLESCPTFRLTGQETESPRGRIHLVKAANEGLISMDGVRPHLEACLGCRACETACPSGVRYGAILEEAKDRLGPSLKARFLVELISRPRILGVALRLAPKKMGAPKPGLKAEWPALEVGSSPLGRSATSGSFEPSPPTGEDFQLLPIKGKVAFLEGCAMRVTHPRAHEAARRLLRRVGFEVVPVDLGCCGSLHAHNGQVVAAKAMREKAVGLAAGLPLVADSAGCGAWLRDHPGSGVVDVSVFLWENGLADLLAQAPGSKMKAAYHDACHHSHGQGVRNQPRELLRSVPGLELLELPSPETCCGSAGIYSSLQPKTAKQLLESKVEAIRSTGADTIVTGNPGCLAWIQKGMPHFPVLHTVEVLEMAFHRS